MVSQMHVSMLYDAMSYDLCCFAGVGGGHVVGGASLIFVDGLSLQPLPTHKHVFNVCVVGWTPPM
jgi:hypothetical protein